MSLQHLVFVQCADACSDAHISDIFVGLAYGLYPFCVQLDGGHSLVFRRSNAAVERDRVQRAADAADDLAALPAVRAYNAAVPDAMRLRVTGGDGARAPAVVWPTEGPLVADHVAIIPALLEWTRWDRDTAWVVLRRGWAAMMPPAADGGAAGEPAAPPRHLRLAHALDLVGVRALQAMPGDYAGVARLCQTVMQDVNAGHREIVLDERGAVRDVV